MGSAVKITRLELENVKRIKAIELEPNENGLTVIGGKNGEGKTSVLDAIAWALGGEKRRPTNAQREGSVLPPEIRVVLNNGLIVERKGKNSTLSVTDPTGKKAGQALLDSFVEQFALDIPKFLNQSDKEKANTLLKVIGIGGELEALDAKEKELYTRRTIANRILKDKAAYAQSLPEYAGTPEEYIDPAELIARQQEILSENAENARKRMEAQKLQMEYERLHREREDLYERYIDMSKTLDEKKKRLDEIWQEANALIDEPTDELEEQLASFTEINRKVRANKDKRKAEEELLTAQNESDTLTSDLNSVREERINLLKNADLPLENLTVEEGILLYKGKAWDCMSASEQLVVATAIVRKLKPQCGFVLLDKLEQLDRDTLKSFGEWLKGEELQVIATRVSASGDDCTIIIEDGRAVTPTEPVKTQIRKWKGAED